MDIVKGLTSHISPQDINLSAIFDLIATYFKTSSPLSILKDYLLFRVTYRLTSRLLFNVYAYGPIGYLKHITHHYTRNVFQWLLTTRPIRGKVDPEVKDAIVSIQKDLMKDDPSLPNHAILPAEGLPEATIVKELDELQTVLPHSSWEEGRVSGAVYHGGHDLIELQSKAFEKYCVANQLHPDVFPGVRKIESEVVAMILRMFHAPEETGCGTTTSGGTESLLLACLSAKMYALRTRGVTEPEMVVPVTAHAGFDKAAYYFGIKIHHVELDPVTYKVDLKKVERFINGNTVLLVGSVPNFPHGIADDIEGLGRLAEKYNIPLHVDCCLGSFVVAFMEQAGFGDDIPTFDFRVKGVTSISCDTHKYGFAPKGSSVVMYRTPELRMHQYYVNSSWTGGLYGSPTLAGSRPGALVVACWATMLRMGANGYIESCRQLVNAARKLRRYIEENIPELQIVGDPKFSVIAVTSSTLDIYELSDRLSKRGWHMSTLQKPAALHFAVTVPSVHAIDDLCQQLSEAVSEMLAEGPENQVVSKMGTSALYGISGSVKVAGVAERLIVGFLDALYKL